MKFALSEKEAAAAHSLRKERREVDVSFRNAGVRETRARKQKNLGRGELGHGLGALRDGVLGELSGEDQAHGGLDLPGGDRRLLVVARELGGLGGDLEWRGNGRGEEEEERGERRSEFFVFFDVEFFFSSSFAV